MSLVESILLQGRNYKYKYYDKYYLYLQGIITPNTYEKNLVWWLKSNNIGHGFVFECDRLEICDVDICFSFFSLLKKKKIIEIKAAGA